MICPIHIGSLTYLQRHELLFQRISEENLNIKIGLRYQ
jgi:hypothetical protein